MATVLEIRPILLPSATRRIPYTFYHGMILSPPLEVYKKYGNTNAKKTRNAESFN